MGELLVDSAFIQPEAHRPKLNPIQHVDGIPLIDLSISDSKGLEQLVSEINSACEKWGFFQVINHGVPSELRSRVEIVARRFFSQATEEKRKVKRDEVNAMGYHDSEHTKNVRDWKEVFDFLVEDPTLVPASVDADDEELRTLTNQWPQQPLDIRQTCEEYAKEVEKLAHRLLELISLGLGLPAEKLKANFKNQTSMARLNYYPSCPFPDLALGVGRHKDAGALTVLAQDDVGGLEVKRISDGEWVAVKPIRDAYIINIGDILQVWSNDRYESAEHRVRVNREKGRFSMPFFLLPSHSVMVKPLEELLSDQNPSKYQEYNWGKFFAARHRSDFEKQDVENVQVHHFKLAKEADGVFSSCE